MLANRRTKDAAGLVEELIAALGADRVSTNAGVLERHGRDESSFDAPPPSAVVFAECTQDVADAVKLASDYSVPVRMMSPLAVTTSSPSTFSRMVP